MANAVLLCSSLLFSVMHLSMMLDADIFRFQFYAFVWIRGCASSVANHMLTSDRVREYDRVVMFESAIVDLIFINMTAAHGAGVLMLAAAGAYLLAKLIERRGHRWLSNACHLVAHALITASHCMIASRLG